MRKYITIYEEAVSHIGLCTQSLSISLYEENFILFFVSDSTIDYHITPYLNCDIEERQGDWRREVF
jgi:hypothetical protein